MTGVEARMALLALATTAAFFLGPIRWRHAVLIVSGLVFYAWSAAASLPLVLGMIAVAHLASGRPGLWLQMLLFTGLLVIVKARGQGTVSSVMLGQSSRAAEAFVPLGLSFLAFELLHVAIERSRHRLARPSFPALAAFALYFPCRVAGPIKRFQPFEASLQASRWSLDRAYRGFVRMIYGWAKKVVLADTLALFAAHLHDAATPAVAWGALTAYGVALYLDFSAYSDAAIGMSWILGLRVPENFRAPYLSRNIRDFWTRWHMSLSSWLADYVFLPTSQALIRSRIALTPRAAAVIAYLVTFALCGLWHGLAGHFLLWGLYHGVLLSGYALASALGLLAAGAARLNPLPEQARRALAVGVTFLLVTLGWTLFALETQAALRLWRVLCGLAS